jgi:histidinol-phosphatase (PHP family)
MKIKSSYHVHSSYCDGKNSLEEMALSAIAKNFTHLGFSSHAPVPQNATLQWIIFV